MPSPTGIWTPEEAATGHVFDYRLAQWLGQYFPKDKPLIDLGCGHGTYLRYFHDIGFQQMLGVEGTVIPGSEFSRIEHRDLTEPFTLQYTGNIMCLEVAEHIPYEHMDTFLQNIIRHLYGKLVLSWGVPGQDGLGHVNCQHNIWVVDLLKNYGLRLNTPDSMQARIMVSDHARWLRDTIMVFEQ